MSLLLEALKKAEKAKEEAQRRAGGEAEPAASSFDLEATVVDPTKHITTRDELPDIHAPLEILSEDLHTARQKGRPLELSIEEVAPPSPAPAPRPAAPAPPPHEPASRANAPTQDQNADRAAAQKVFEAKFKEPNPRLPFYITIGVLSAFAVGTVGYFWYQLRPPPALVNANPPRPAGELPPAAVDAKPAAGAPAADAKPAIQAAIPGLPGTPSPTAPAAAPAATAPSVAPAPAPIAAPAPTPMSKPAPTAPAQSAAPSTAPAASARAPRTASPRAKAPGADERALTVSRAGAQVHPRVASGYAAYQAGDLTLARTDYEQALREDATNRDAALGLAAVEMRAQRYEQADAIYQRLLQANPRDPHAQAGMLALRGQALDPVQAESRVKSLLAADPEANVLHFTLGNQYAQQGRWAEAQQAYFKAYAGDPENPDYAFNLAVSLDQLRQPALALEYYRRALALAAKRSANFAPDAARTRAQQLSR
ncbi:MAG: tetratricopeptide repeat protein [Betaproteobacteria bacterium]